MQNNHFKLFATTVAFALALVAWSGSAQAACNPAGWTPAMGPQLDANGNQCTTNAGTSPLPTGAATAANQGADGTGITPPTGGSGERGWLSGIFKALGTALGYATPDNASVGTTSGILITAGTYTRSLTICTLPTSTTNVWLNPRGATAIVSTGFPVFAGGGCVNFSSAGGAPIPSANITAITDAGTAQTVTLAGG